MNIEVTTCKECPLANWDYEVCNHPQRKERIDIYQDLKALPIECPLILESTTISIKLP